MPRFRKPWCLAFLFGLSIFLFFPKSRLAQVYINEILPDPAGSGNEWVELYNSSPGAISLEDWILTDKANKDQSLSGLGEISAGGFVVYEYSGEGWLNNSGGDTVYLKDNSVLEIDNYGYSELEEGESVGRSPDGSENWIVFDTPSPGGANPSSPTTTPTPTSSATGMPTATPTQSELFSLKANFDSSVAVGEDFDVEVVVDNADIGREYFIKVRIGKNTSELNKGETYSESEGWLGDGAAWVKFPKFKTNEEGDWSGYIKARVKSGVSSGSYYLEVRLWEVEGDKKYKDSESYPLTVSVSDSPASTSTPAPTNTPAKTPTPTKKLTLTPTPKTTLSPTPSVILKKEGNALGDTGSGGEILGEAKETVDSANEKNSKTRLIAGGLIGIGGALAGGAYFINKKDKQDSDTMENDEGINEGTDSDN